MNSTTSTATFVVFTYDDYTFRHQHIADATSAEDAIVKIEEVEKRIHSSMFIIYKSDDFSRSVLNAKCPVYSHYRNVANRHYWRGQSAPTMSKCVLIDGKYYFE